MSRGNLSFGNQQQESRLPDATSISQEEEEVEEFVVHLKFDQGSYPLRYNVNEMKFLGMTDGHLVVKIGNSYFLGEYAKQNNSSIVFAYHKPNKEIYETHKCRSKIFMKRVMFKPKHINDDDDS